MPTPPVTYAQLAEYLAFLGDMGDLGDVGGLSPLVQEVRVATLRAHLLARQSDLLDSDDAAEQAPILLEFLISAATEVQTYAGPDPENATLRALSVDAIGLETASRIEYGLYPEQQSAGDSGRGFFLHRTYLERLASIRKHPDARALIRPASVVHDMSGYDPQLCPDFPEVI